MSGSSPGNASAPDPRNSSGGGPSEAPFARLFAGTARLAAHFCAAPISVLGLLTGDRLRILASSGCALADRSRPDGFSPLVPPCGQAVIVPDTREDPRFSPDVLSTLPAAIRSCAAVPFTTSDPTTTGAICVMDLRPRDYAPRDVRALGLLADQVPAQLELGRRQSGAAAPVPPLGDRPPRLHETTLLKLKACASEDSAFPAVPDAASAAVAVLRRILVLEDEPAVVYLIRQILGDSQDAAVEVSHQGSLAGALKLLARGPHDIALVDLELPDSHGLDTLREVQRGAPHMPVVILTGHGDERMALEAVRRGAEDYLFKGDFNGPMLVRSLRYAVERQRLKTALRIQSLTDDLTRLYNRRGFRVLAEHQLRVAERTMRPVSLVFADLDGLKGINDTCGHAEGDRALLECAEILRETFRGSDILARIGGDEFVVMTPESGGTEAEILHRLQSALDAHNAYCDRPYALSVSAGVAHFDPGRPCTLAELLGRADVAMYAAKRAPPGR